MSFPTISVSELNTRVKSVLDGDKTLKNLMVTGEISNFGVHRASGHLYFSLKDERSSVKAVMFRANALRLRFAPENGVKVVAVGSMGYFERDGACQFYVDELIPDGAGALMVAFEQLKARLAARGLFDASHKRPLPAYPKRIGVITSPTGAVRRDVENVVARRWPHVELLICGVSVQGKTAAGEIVAALKRFNAMTDVDLLIIARGGGSMEDLWCFNDETLAQAVYDSRIPVISAVGHETDFTICDFVADVRAPTPSAAAELAVPDGAKERARLNLQSRALLSACRKRLSLLRAQLDVLNARRDFSDVSAFFSGEHDRVDRLFSRVGVLARQTVSVHSLRLKRDESRLLPAVLRVTQAEKLRLARGTTRLNETVKLRYHTERERFSQNVAALKSLNPLDVLLRGYAVLEDEKGILTSVRSLNAGDSLKAVLSDGEALCRVTEVKEGKTYGKHDL